MEKGVDNGENGVKRRWVSTITNNNNHNRMLRFIGRYVAVSTNAIM